MKTNKEIKPFKMRVTEIQSENIQKIIVINGYELADMWTNHEVLVFSINTLYSFHGKCFNLSMIPEPELTYSEFMKLYGEEEEVFTRDDMIMFAELCLFNGCNTKDDVQSEFDNFLSERTND